MSMVNSNNRRSFWDIFLEIILIIFAVVWIYPFILILFNSFKTVKDMMIHFIEIPWNFQIQNYIMAWSELEFFRALINTFILSAGGVAGIILFGSMAAYKLSRTKTRYSYIILGICIAPMMVPFQTIMITLTQVAKQLHLSGSLLGLIVQYWGVSAPFAIFLYHGFVKMIPKELDESAMIDGASSFRLFFQIIFPLLKSITITAVVINALYIWNDFILPLLMISSNKATRNIQISLYSNFGVHEVRWELALPGLILSVIPAVIFFIALQKYIIEGVAAGAVKG